MENNNGKIVIRLAGIIIVDNLMDVIIDFIEIEKIVKLFKKVVDNAFKKC